MPGNKIWQVLWGVCLDLCRVHVPKMTVSLLLALNLKPLVNLPEALFYTLQWHVAVGFISTDMWLSWLFSSGIIFFHHFPRYQQMSEREKRDFNLGDRNNDHGTWKHPSHLHPTLSQQQPSKPLPVLAKPVASVLSIWTSRQRSEANSYHLEFAGRRYGERTELYKSLNNSRSVLLYNSRRTVKLP